eukprot:m.20573 g.20573  ORF g.20573 m.20573 type:complete len:79 (+) comp3805_c0_seq2:270-506(+)
MDACGPDDIAALRMERDDLQAALAVIKQDTAATKRKIATEIATSKAIKENVDAVKKQSATAAERLRTLYAETPSLQAR